MSSTYSPTLRLELIGAGEQSGVWNTTTNANLGTLIEQAITGVQTIAMVDANKALSALNGSPDESRNAVLVMTSIGDLSATRDVIVPPAEKLYVIKNSTTGNQSIRIKTSGGAGVTVPNGKTMAVYCDGTNTAVNTDYFSTLVVDTLSVTNLTLGSGTTGTGEYVRKTDATLTSPTITTPIVTGGTYSSPTLTGTPVAPTAPYSTNTTQIATTAFVQAALQAIYPVGTVYTNAANAANPSTFFGFGTWVEIGAGRVLIGQDTGDTSFDVLGETGGSKDAVVVAHTHTGSTGNAGAHNHSVNDPTHSHQQYTIGENSGIRVTDHSGQDTWEGEAYRGFYTTASATGISLNGVGDHTHTVTVNSTGSSGTNANLQPYVVVKMWQRTA